MTSIPKCLILGAVVCMALCGGGWAESLMEQCSKQLPQVLTCTNFASGKDSTPQQKCCDSVKAMKESNPACLCFVIQQVHNKSSPALQQFNIQESRLLQLPSACKIADASISDCPKLLKLPPNSPDAAIFNNVTNTVSTPTTAGGTPSASTSPSHGFKQEATTSIIVSAIIFLVFLLSGFSV